MGKLLETQAANATGLDAAAVAAAMASVANKADLVAGKIPASQIPDIAVVDYLGAVANQTAMLALVGQKGDWCARTDLNTTWIITGANPAILAGWTQLRYPASGAGTVTATFTEALPFSAALTDLGVKYVNSPLTFTVNATGTARLNAVTATIVADGINAPAFTGLVAHSSDAGYVNTYGVVNTLNGWYDGLKYYFQWSQDAALSPVAFPNSNPAAAYTRFDVLGARMTEQAGGSSGAGYLYDITPGWPWDVTWSRTSALSKPAGNTGYLRAVYRIAASSSQGLFLHDTQASPTLATVLYGVVGSKGGNAKGDVTVFSSNTNPAAASNVLADGDLLELAWTPTTVAAKYSTDAGATWTLLYTWTISASQVLYPHIAGNAGGTIERPLGYGLL